MRGGRGIAVAGLLALAGGAWAPSPAGAQNPLGLVATRGDRQVALAWRPDPELWQSPSPPPLADSLFGGYHVWRATSPDPERFILIRRFQRRYPVSWTYRPAHPDSPRVFTDPDSVVRFTKIQITPQGDSAIVREYVGIRPFNGFPYFYAATWFSECLSLQNDTVSVHLPQPPILDLGGGRFGFLSEGDTLEVNRVPCRRIDPVTSRPVGDTTFVYQGRADSEEALRHYAIENTQLQAPVFPSSTPRSTLRDIRVIPNPYVSSAPWDEPGRRKIQFVNLPERAQVSIYTASADLVRVLDHPAPGSPPDQGSADWDLKNADGRLVESGIYFYQVEVPGRGVDFQGRLVIVR